MPTLHSGARQLPLRHISIRVPWNDLHWEGVVCRAPRENLSCLILPRIREARTPEKIIAQEQLAGQSWKDLQPEQLPPCVSERGGFMAPFELKRRVTHPYATRSKAHEHFLPTLLRYPPYSALCVPYQWMLSESAQELARDLDLNYQPELESAVVEEMGFGKDWLQTRHNQLVLLDTFYSAIQPQRSLCFFYAKRIPLVEDPRRVIIGAGWVEHVGEAVEYEYSTKMPHRAMLWERTIQHSIRPKFKNGFLLPYQEIQQHLSEHPDKDPLDYVAFAPNEHFWSYSYGSEHVTNDGAIGSLLACAKALQSIEQAISGPWRTVFDWIDARLNELWKMRGTYPGLGAALTAFGLAQGTLVAYELERLLAARDTENVDPWAVVDQMFRDPQSIGADVQKHIGTTLRKKWQALPDERRALLKLISRFELSGAQATRYYVHEDKQRRELNINLSDQDVLHNPYLLFESDRGAPDPVQLSTVDRGVFPEAVIREQYPLAEPSRVDDATDPRRVRAFVVRELEEAAVVGDTLQPRDTIIQRIRARDVQPACSVDSDTMNVVEALFSPPVNQVLMGDGQKAYQLDRLSSVGQVIRTSVERRIKGTRHVLDVPWRQLLDEALSHSVASTDELELKARQEKTAALEQLFASRLSILVGPAGTGKTTLLKVLCNLPQVKNSGVLLLAPTGKARVRMEQQIGIRGAKTIAQFLLPLERYFGPTGAYRLSARDKVDAGRTVIIDEASMLTEEQLAATLDALKNVERLILVGDARQLPPIGAGRPFLDIVRQLEPENVESLFPRVGSGYAELTIRRRQQGEARDDLLLADWFSGRTVDPGADEIWDKLHDEATADKPISPHLRFVRWDHPDELQEKFLTLLVEELKLVDRDDQAGFEQTLGGTPFEQSGVFFWPGRNGKAGACAKVESWQVLSPIRALPQGVEALNRLIQTTFRANRKRDALKNPWQRKIPEPIGPEEILYGDKVINVQNHVHKDVWPEDGALRYVANGEMGIVVGQYRTKNFKGNPWKLEVEFATQPSYKYGYGKGFFGEEDNPKLELAYALTIHKAQGSEFGLTFVVVPNPCRPLSRELLYTALTRQRERVIILHQGERHALKRFASDQYSEAARRLSNLFRPPMPVSLDDRFLEEHLIHRTRRGESVRSKSEVVIANLLNEKRIEYDYETRLVGTDGHIRYPDFTIQDSESGRTIYWEHLGLMYDPTYRKRWETKLAWYRQQGILPVAEGGGPRAMLVTTADDERGGIDSMAIERVINELFDKR